MGSSVTIEEPLVVLSALLGARHSPNRRQRARTGAARSLHEPIPTTLKPGGAAAIALRYRKMAKKKLTKAERAVDEAMLAMLEWSSERPKGWHGIGKLPEFKTAAELLEKRGIIETRQPMNQYRLKPTKI